MDVPETDTEYERVAIIGMAGRFPKSRDLDEFWANLRDGVECISFSGGHDEAVADDPTFVPAGGVLDDIDLFDAPFFGISARDAETMDPQQRLFLECCWHGLEAAGYNPETYKGLIGVFAGAAQSFYMSDLYTNTEALASLDDFQIAIGNDKDHLTTQVSYRLNLRGPGLTVQTACSTSLVSVCIACQSLLNYQCDIALAGGVAADSSTGEGYTYQPGGILSPDGHCRVFDAAAQGTVPGNGVGVVVLKRLSEALADRDHICAIISGFALNNDGLRKVGYTAPSVTGQAEVIALAHALAGVDPETITYVEAHGTGTALGDPIEIAALDQVFRARTSRRGFCAIGSVKSNIGHLDTAAGVAGLIKVVLALEHERIPPTLHFSQPNPEIDFENSAFRVNTRLAEWSRVNGSRRAGVSSFGIGGTNAHVVLEEAPAPPAPGRRRPYCLLTLSARTDTALETMTDNLAGHLARHPDADLASVAYTLHVGRKAFDRRRVLVCRGDDAEGARAALVHRDPRLLRTRTSGAKGPRVCFMFPGQGTQQTEMALDVYRGEPLFRELVDRCAELLQPHLGLDLRELLYPEANRRDEAAPALRRTAYTQPALFTIEYALARLWMQWGVEPAAMIGHSVGELVAACLADVLTIEDALGLVAARARAMDAMPPGAMLAVALSESAAEQYVDGAVSLAAINGPAACVLSGPPEAVDRVAGELEQRGVRAQLLAVSHAFHSAMMDPAADRLLAAARAVPMALPRLPFVSNVTGAWIEPEAATDPRYWSRQLRQTVRFADGLQELYRSGDYVLLEVGPGRTLANLARQHPDADGRQPIFSSLPPRAEGSSDLESLISTFGSLWLAGVEPDWSGFHADEGGRRAPLPSYPFERHRYWIGPAADQGSDTGDEHAAGSSGEPTTFFSYPAWTPASPPRPADAPGTPPSRWLVFGDDSELSRALVRELRDAGSDVVTVLAGEAFASLDATTYTLRPGQPTDYDELLTRLETRAGALEAVAHLWSAAPPTGAALDAQQDQGFFSLVQLAQALERRELTTPLDLNVVTSGVASVLGHEPLDPARATVIAPCRVIPQEYPHIRCRLVDVDDPSGAAGSVVAELTREPFEPTVAYRRGRRWLQAFDGARFAPAEGRPPRTRDGGVYLITGGLGKIGRVLSGFLARTVADAKLVLTGRSELPPESQWDAWLEDDPGSPLAQRIRGLRDLRADGTVVLYRPADAADTQAMARVVEEAERRFGRINGVVHAAGDTESYTPVNEVKRGDVERQLRAKLHGAIVLDDLLGGRELDFCVLISSLSSLVGGVGLVAYAAANCFLDGLASSRNQQGRTPWISIDWCAWHFPAEDELADGALLREANAILPAEGEAAFEAILARAPGQVVVSRMDVRALYDEVVRGAAEPAELEVDDVEAAAFHARPELSTPYAPPRSPDEQLQATIWQELLGVGPIGVFDDFFELGGHSLLAIQLISRLRRAFDVDVPVSRVFEFPTIADLAESIGRARAAVDEQEATTAAMLELVEHLSDSDVRALLDDGGAAP